MTEPRRTAHTAIGFYRTDSKMSEQHERLSLSLRRMVEDHGPAERRPLSPIARVKLAEQAHETRVAERNDPGRQLLTKVRAAHVGMAQVHAAVDREYERQNAPVPPPPGIAGLMHPSRRAALEAMMKAQGWSDRATDPVVEMPTREEIVGTMLAEAKTQIEEAETALADFEDERRREALGEVIGPVAVVDPPRRGPGRPKRSD